jgi:hypothetical protein
VGAFSHDPTPETGASMTFLHLRLRSGEPCYVRAEHVTLVERERITLLGGQVLDVGRENVLRLLEYLGQFIEKSRCHMAPASEEDYWT